MAIESEAEREATIRSWPAPHPHDLWFLLLVLLTGWGSVFAFSRLGVALTQPAIGTTTRLAQEQLYSFPSNTGLMQPAIDAKGVLWVGEMYANRLGSIDTNTGAVKEWQVPHGNDGIMDVTIGPNGHVWYVEQDANYIGSFDPVTQHFQVFPLNKCNGRDVGPQDLQFDAQGNLWFTGASSGCIVVLHPAGGTIGRFHPDTGQTQLYHLQKPNVQIFSMDADAQGRIWFSEMMPGALGMLDPKTGHITELPVPATSGQPAAMYELIVTHNGDVWCVNSGSDTLVAYEPTKNHYTIFKLANLTGAPYGITLDTHNYLWVTYSGTQENAVGKIKASLS